MMVISSVLQLRGIFEGRLTSDVVQAVEEKKLQVVEGCRTK